MSMRYKGGVISATPPTTSSSSAPGIWTLEQQLQAKGAGNWPVLVGWIATLGGASNDIAYGIATDSSGNSYIAASATISGTQDISLSKYDSSGTIQWQRALSGGVSSTEDGRGIAVDSSNNVYVVGTTDQGISNDAFIAKYNSTGVIQWQRTLGTTGGQTGLSIAVDSSGNAYITGVATDILIAKYNTSGTLQWQRTLGGAGDDSGNGIAVDSSANVYVVGSTNSTGAGSYDAVITKYNTSGTIQWQRVLGGASVDLGTAIAVDSSANVYIAGQNGSSGAGSNDILIAKYDTSGTIQWQRSLGNTGSDIGYGISIDSSNNVYVTGQLVSGGNFYVAVAKYNSSGAIQFQRSLGTATKTNRGYSINASVSSTMYVAGETNTSGAGNADILITKLPNDGSPTGTYGSFVYAAGSMTDSASSLTSSTSTLTDAAASLTSTTSTLTDAASSLTSTVTTV